MNLQEELKALKQRIVELEELANEEQEFPQYGDEYWYINTQGKVLKDSWGGFGFERNVLEIGNTFRNEEQAEFAVEKLKVEAELRKFSGPFKEDENNYYIELYLFDKTLSIDVGKSFQKQGAFYFESKEKAQQAIESVGEERIKKYIFGVED